jgi:hypothetical protein
MLTVIGHSIEPLTMNPRQLAGVTTLFVISVLRLEAALL